MLYRQATMLGDLIMQWEGKVLRINARLSTQKERERVDGWLKDHPGLTVEGDLAAEAVIHGEEAVLHDALSTYIQREIGEAGYLVYAIDKRGRGRVLSSKTDVKVVEEKEIVKAAQTRGG